MKKSHRKYLMIIGGLILMTALAMVYTSASPRLPAFPPAHTAITPGAQDGVVSVNGTLVQDKVLYGSTGEVTMGLTLSARKKTVSGISGDDQDVDMVIVLDRSGSMVGEKIESARRAIGLLLRSLTPSDRFALVAYSNKAQRYIDLTPVSGENLCAIESTVLNLEPGGGTNIGAGISEGLNLLQVPGRTQRLKKMVLISDGLANQGITDPERLGDMAAMAPEIEVSLTTVGVGLDFNEHLMTRLADRGTGDFYFLENPKAFAQVFIKEYKNIRSTAATSLEIAIPLKQGVELVDAAGYPIRRENGVAMFHPGDLRSGQTRKIFLTFRVPTDKTHTYKIDDIRVQYHSDGEARAIRIPASFQVACVKKREDVWASIKKSEWGDKVLQEDYSRLKEEVATHIKAGRKAAALERIEDYRMRQSAINAVVSSPKVQKNLDDDLGALNEMVNHTFEGEARQVMEKKKLNSKNLQYDSYQKRRAKQQ